MPNNQVKSQERDKRAGNERRQPENSSQRAGIERRNSPERRQTSITEISYFEWASHFVKFQGLMHARKSADSAE